MAGDGVIGVREAPTVLRSIGIEPGKRYDPTEFQALLTQAKADRLKVAGYVLRVDLDGKVSIVHWTKADDFQSTMRDEWRQLKAATGDRPEILVAGGRQPREEDLANPVDAGSVNTAVRKRTPQERLDSLLSRWVEDCMRAGTVPGLNDPMISTILDVAFKAGKTEITAENVRTVARFFLEKAEKEKEAANRKLIARPPHGS